MMNTAGAVGRFQRTGFDEVHRLEVGGTVAFVVLHRAIRGRTFGGIRIRPYDREDDALDDACELARAMSRKVVLAGIEGGGAKAVMIEPEPRRREEAVRGLGRFIESLGGRYFCGGDLGFTAADHQAVSAETGFIACSGLGRDSARSVHAAMRAVIDPRRVAIQGLGSIGRPLAEMLAADGVEVFASDLAPEPGDGPPRVPPEAIYDAECDVFAPCAIGHVLDRDTVERLRAAVVCGGANNPFASDGDADRLEARGIVYVPDVIANAGATIRGASTAIGEVDRIEERFAAIPGLVREVVERGRRERVSPHRTASQLADERIAAWSR